MTYLYASIFIIHFYAVTKCSPRYEIIVKQYSFPIKVSKTQKLEIYVHFLLLSALWPNRLLSADGIIWI